MKVSIEDLRTRADQLERLANQRGVAWRDQAASLDADDPVAKIGLLASLLGFEPRSAFHPEAELIAIDQPSHR